MIKRVSSLALFCFLIFNTGRWKSYRHNILRTLGKWAFLFQLEACSLCFSLRLLSKVINPRFGWNIGVRGLTVICLGIPILFQMVLAVIHPASGQEEQCTLYYGLRTFV